MLDSTLLLFICLFCFFGFIRGFISEISALISLLIALFLAFQNKYIFVDIIEIDNISIAQLASCIVVYLIALILHIIIHTIFISTIKPIRLGLIDRFLGMLFGVTKGIFLSLIVLVVIHSYVLKTNEESEDIDVPAWLGRSNAHKGLIYLIDEHSEFNSISDYLSDTFNDITFEIINKFQDYDEE